MFCRVSVCNFVSAAVVNHFHTTASPLLSSPLLSSARLVPVFLLLLSDQTFYRTALQNRTGLGLLCCWELLHYIRLKRDSAGGTEPLSWSDSTGTISSVSPPVVLSWWQQAARSRSRSSASCCVGVSASEAASTWTLRTRPCSADRRGATSDSQWTSSNLRTTRSKKIIMISY